MHTPRVSTWALSHRSTGRPPRIFGLSARAYLALITDLRIGKESIEKAGSRRDALLEELHGAYAGAPSTTVAAYKRAQKSLQQQEEMTFSDAEIDAFLPKELRKTQLQPNGDGATGRDAS